jgi:group I intron endonuclease
MKIYCIENKLDGKKYVGKTTKTIEKRFKQHIKISESDTRQHLHNAIRKYKQENFECYLLEDVSYKKLLSEREMYWIKELNTKNTGYNETDGGDGSFGRQVSEDTRKKHSEQIKKYYSNPDNRKKVSDATKEGMKRWWHSLSEEDKKDYKKKCSKRPEGWVQPTGWTYTHTDEAKQSISIAQKNRKRSKEEIEKIKKTKKERGCGLGEKNAMSNEENRKKVSQSKIGRKRVYQPDGSFKYLYPDRMS